MNEKTIASLIRQMYRKGTLIARVKRAETGKWEKIWEKAVDNLITDDGIQHITGMLGDVSTYPAFVKAGIGTGSTGATTSDSALETAYGAQQTPVFTRVTTTITDDTSQFVSSHTIGDDSTAITEYGLFTLAAVMFNHVIFAAITLDTDDVLEFTYKVKNTDET